MTDKAKQRPQESLHQQRLEYIEDQVKSLRNAQRRQDERIEKVEQISQQLLMAMAQVHVKLNNIEHTVVEENRQNRSIITQLIAFDQKRDEEIAKANEMDKQRRQERWLKAWSVIAPLAAALISALFGSKQ